MADERRAHEFDVALATIAYLGQSFAGQFRPGSANPYRQAPPREKTAEEAKAESDEGWALLKTGLASMAGARG